MKRAAAGPLEALYEDTIPTETSFPLDDLLPELLPLIESSWNSLHFTIVCLTSKSHFQRYSSKRRATRSILPLAAAEANFAPTARRTGPAFKDHFFVGLRSSSHFLFIWT